MDGMNLFIWRLGLKMVLEISLIRFRKCGTTFSHPMGEGMFSLALKSATNSFTRLNASSKPVGMVGAIVRWKSDGGNYLVEG